MILTFDIKFFCLYIKELILINYWLSQKNLIQLENIQLFFLIYEII